VLAVLLGLITVWISRIKAVTESTMIGDAVTMPLTNDPIHGKMDMKMKGSDSAKVSERIVKAINAWRLFFFSRSAPAEVARMKVHELTMIVANG
jgi:hypothetical protein